MAAIDHPRFFNAVISTSSSGVNIETGLLSTRSASQPPSLERSPTPRVDPQRWGISTSRSGEILVSVVTGTKDKDYNIIWFTEVCLSNALRLQTYIEDAEREGDKELAEFFRRAQHESKKGA